MLKRVGKMFVCNFLIISKKLMFLLVLATAKRRSGEISKFQFFDTCQLSDCYIQPPKKKKLKNGNLQSYLLKMCSRRRRTRNNITSSCLSSKSIDCVGV